MGLIGALHALFYCKGWLVSKIGRVGTSQVGFLVGFGWLRWALLWVQIFRHLGLRTFLAVQALTAFVVGVSSPSNMKVLPKDGIVESL